ncbi:MAG: cytochrome c peroxidase [Planctomycetota bacterium]|nr:cytochrome c peroxidase [Planctomycetota bacterium]
MIRVLSAAAAATLLLASMGCGSRGAEERAPSPLSEDATRWALRMSPVPPVPADPTNRHSEDERAAELGRRLFHTTALSKGGEIACATCHLQEYGLADGRTLAEGVLPLERHTPALWNVAHQRWFFWDGRADSLWSQALIPLEDPLEHAFARVEVARAIHADDELRASFEEVFGPMADFADLERFPPYARPVPEDDRAHQLAREHARRRAEGDASARPHHEHASSSGFYHPHQRSWDAMSEADREVANEVFVGVGKALAAFQRRARAASSPFDRFVEGLRAGDASMMAELDPLALRGFELFVGEAGCIACHHGPLFTDMEFHDTRVPAVPGAPEDDPGRARGLTSLAASEFGVLSRWSDDPEGPAGDKVRFLPRHAHHSGQEFKTPSLRNVALTPPYMHNGAFATLEDVVDFYVTREGARPSTAPGETILRPLGLGAGDRAALVAFLESLTDETCDPELLAAPR